MKKEIRRKLRLSTETLSRLDLKVATAARFDREDVLLADRLRVRRALEKGTPLPASDGSYRC